MRLRSRLLTTCLRTAAKLGAFSRKRTHQRCARLRLQPLESRDVPATHFVMTNADSGMGSLREAINSANVSQDADDIIFNTFVTGTIPLLSELSIKGPTTITANITPQIIISGGNSVRVFNTSAAPAGTAISFVNLAISNGKVTGNGAGILASDESVTLTNCTVSGNTATGDGGGIYVGGGTVNGALTIQNCTINNNVAAGSGDGGGIGLNSTFTAPIIVRNSTITGNSATGGYGGGIDFGYYFSGSAKVQNSTITGNAAALGGGIGQHGYQGLFELESAIVYGNSGGVSGPDLSSILAITVKTCLVGSKAGAAFAGDAFSNANIGVNPLLGSLANNGGKTLTQALLAGSPAINNGTNPAGLTTDQRGTGYIRESGGKADIGAFESPSLVVLNANNTGVGSLRQAITEANTIPGANTITFEPTFFATPRTIFLLTGELYISDAVTIAGPGVSLATVSGNNNFRVFNTTPAPAAAAITLSGLTIANGNADGGAGISSFDESVTLSNCVITGNTATNDGGGVYMVSGTLVIQNCSITNNKATGAGHDGGGIGIQGNATVTIQGSTISANTTLRRGGGIFLASGGSLMMSDSTVSGNVAQIEDGGGICLQFGGSLTIDSSTVSGNVAQTDGGGISFRNGGSLTMDNSTVSGNLAQTDDGGGMYQFGGTGIIRNSTISGNSAVNTGHAGGGIFLTASAGLTLKNSTVAYNSAKSAGGGACVVSYCTLTIESTIISNNSCLTSPDVSGKVATTTSFIGDTLNSNPTGSPMTANPMLGALANNGGPTQTHALLSGSPAINKGSNTTGLTTDQRGPGYVRESGGTTDIGAYEYFFSPLVVLNNNDSGAGSLRDAIAYANSNPGTDTVTFDPAFFATPRTITMGGTEMALTDTTGATTISGPGLNLLTVSGNNMGRVLVVNSGVSGALNGMTIANGNSAYGGAVQNSGALTVSSSRFTSNKSDYGGAIFSVGVLSVSNSTFDNNAANFGTGWGGAIINGTTAGAANITACTFTNNYASQLGGALIGFSYNITDSTFANNTSGLNGGAVRTDGTVVISGSTFSGNSASNDGGAIMSHGSTTITNSTLASNTASIGGGIFFFQGTGTMRNITVAYNTSNDTAGNIGGGTQVGTAASVTAINTIVAGNTAASGLNVGGSLTASSSNNLLNLSAAAAGLGTLANNGGPTQTIALLPGSPAINGGKSLGLTTDQRGAGFNRVNSGASDIGAFESKLPPTITNVVFGDGTNQRSMVKQIVVTFSESVSFTGGVASAFTLTRTGTGGTLGNVGLTANPVSGPASVVTITFSGALTEHGSLVDGFYDFMASAAQISGENGALDGNVDGIAGGSYTTVGNIANKFFRQYGDEDGNAIANLLDFAAFRGVFNLGPSAVFDFNNSGNVDLLDFAAFRDNFNLTP